MKPAFTRVLVALVVTLTIIGMAVAPAAAQDWDGGDDLSDDDRSSLITFLEGLIQQLQTLVSDLRANA